MRRESCQRTGRISAASNYESESEQPDLSADLCSQSLSLVTVRHALFHLTCNYFFPLNTQHVFHLVFLNEISIRGHYSPQTEKVWKNNKAQLKRKIMLCQRRWRTQKIIYCAEQVMHVLKCQEAGGGN